ncbi:MAG: bifunctional [glutamine synthetase] adenylyltransferase/[glutamine synthetase]-adenylyl-L-tyrosine phosphorylase [Alphaproteobacteria bacterium]
MNQLNFLSESLVPDPERLPLPADAESAQRGRERWLELAERTEDAAFACFARMLDGDECGARVLDAVFGNSPFLSQCLLAEPEFTLTLFCDGAAPAYEHALDELRRAAPPESDSATVMRALRQAKRRVALLTALADITGAWKLEKITATLSEFAERAISTAAAHLLRDAHDSGDIALADPDAPETGSGLVVLGMGKLGARELNYSSDIDLIVLYDEECVAYVGKDGPQRMFVRMVRKLVHMLDERTGDGYVFRTDLRLRPDPASTPPALSILAAETYYESTGQNWERAAMIKARPVAGDLEAGARFLQFLRPFVWRRNLDFAAIRDIHSIKRQINAVRGGAKVAVAGHNIKLGRGGIREIEFFAQTQQLVWGGRDPSVRSPITCEALGALTEAGHVTPETRDRLIEAYEFLRRLEHRLQMVADQQTHEIPTNGESIAALAIFMGFPDRTSFEDALTEQLHIVEGYYADLFEEAPDLGGPGSLVFTGGEDHPDTIATLNRLGFGDPRAVSAVIRAWHHGRFRATRSTRARELLTELMPALLNAFANTVNPGGALLRFNDFLAGLPAGVQLFSLFHTNPGLLSLLAEIMGSAPQIADTLRRYPILFDAVLTSDFFEAPPNSDRLAVEMEQALSEARDFQDVLDILRRRVNDRLFQIGVHILRGHLNPETAGVPLSDIADTALRTLMPTVEDDLAHRHGRIPGGGMAVVALGKLGGREITIGSDLDLLFVYDSPGELDGSDGARKLPPLQYFTRLSQRFISGLTAPTGEGSLYEVDMRLRPSGNGGPIASSLEAFSQYQVEAAWTWEHMALTRARIVHAPEHMEAPLNQAIRAVLTAKRDPGKLLRDVADMRRRMARERGSDYIWNIKDLRGGLVDIEFIAQYLQLRHANEHPEVLDANTTAALGKLRDGGLLDGATAETLISAMTLWRRLQGMLRLSFGDGFDEATAPQGGRDLLVRGCEADSFDALKATVLETAGRCHDIFVTLIEIPAAAPGDDEEEDGVKTL